MGLPETSTVGATALVGRVDELELLGHWWRGVTEPAVSALAVIVGESGVGKSRLAEEFAVDVAASGATVLVGAATDHGFLPYQPWVTALRSFMLTASPDEHDLAVGERAAEFAAIPWLRDLVSGGTPSSLGLPDQTAVTQLVAGVLARLASRNPTLVVLEDIHWSDRGSINVLRQIVAEAMPNVGIVLVERRPSTSRGPWTESLDAFGSRWELSLARLSHSSCRDLLTDVVPDLMCDELVDAVHDASGGNPFVALSLADLAARSSMGPELWASHMPQTAAAIWSARFSPLGPETRAALLVAAVVGTVFDPRLVAAALGQSDAAATAFNEAVGAGLVVPGDVQSLQFAHALVREHLYGNLTATRRRRLHRAVARALTPDDATEPSASSAQRAHHWRASGPSGRRETLIHSIAASAWALEQGAPGEASELGDQALRLIEQLGSEGAVTDADLASRRADLGGVLLRLGHPDGVRLMRDAAAYYEPRNDIEALARITDQLLRAGQNMGVPEMGSELATRIIPRLGAVDPRLHSRILARLGRAFETRTGAEAMETALSSAALRLARETADPETLAIALFCHVVDEPWTDRRLERARELIELGKLHGDPEWVLLGNHLAGTTLLDRGDLDEAVELTEELESLGSAVPPGYIGTIRNADLATEARVIIALRQLLLAQWRGHLDDQARLIAELSELLVEPALELDRLIAAVSLQRGLLAYDRGEFDALVDLVVAYTDDRPEESHRQIGTAFVLAGAGRPDDAFVIYRRILDSKLELVTTDLATSFMLNLLARLSFGFADADGAALIEHALDPYAGRSSTCAGGSMGPVDAGRAYCAATRGDGERAFDLLDRAQQQCEVWRSPPALARVHLARAEITIRVGGPPEQAAAAARAAVEVATPLKMHGVIRAARLLMPLDASLDGDAPP